MIRINLLPHRAEKRRIRKLQFAVLSGLSLFAGLLVVAFVHMAIESQKSYQERRNEYLRQQISILDKQIVEIKKLREQTKSLMARKTVVEDLQSTRSNVVHLLDQMLYILPDGVYLRSLKQTGENISIVGYAQSNARVSTLMRAITDSPWLHSPTLIDIHAGNADGRRVSEFSLTFTLAKPETAASGQAGKPKG